MKLAAFSMILLAGTGCLAGERAASGVCPDGEVCSDATPDGVYFRGEPLVGDLFYEGGPRYTAVGGTQRVHLEDAYDFAFGQAYRAESSDPAVTIAAQQGATVTIAGALDGTSYLRIIDPSDDTLYDRYLVSAAPLATMAIVPTRYENDFSAQPVAFAAGSIDVGVMLYGEAASGYGARLVDDSMTLSAPGATRLAWDTLHFDDAPAGELAITVAAAGHAAQSLSVTVVPAVTAILTDPANPQELPAGASGQLCFAATAGAYRVADLGWSFSVDGDPMLGFLYANCITVRGTAVGTLHVTAQAGPISRTVSVTIRPASATRTKQTLPSMTRPFAGERAATPRS